MGFLNDRRTVLILGGALALLAGLLIGWALTSKGKGEKTTPPPASTAGLVIDSKEDDGKLDPARPLRCFVAGQFVGELTLADCAKRNGVATGSLDVGVDESGALAAADQAGTVLTPLPPTGPAAQPAPAPNAPPPAPGLAPAVQAASAPAGACWRYAGGEWRRLTGDLTLNACVQTLFAGRCERAGGASYGRWMSQTLRLVPGRVEVSGDNRSFRQLGEQSAACVVAPIG